MSDLLILNNSYDKNPLLKEAIDAYVDQWLKSGDPRDWQSYAETGLKDGEDVLTHKRRLAESLDHHVVTSYGLTTREQTLPDIEQIKKAFGDLLIAWKEKSPYGYINVYVPSNRIEEAIRIEKTLGLEQARM